MTVFKALRRELPAEDLVYLGDTARVPYGSKTREAVTRFSLEIARFLERRGIKLLVVACSTASSLALEALRREVSVPVVGVIDPAVRAAVAASRGGAIGVIGTEATIASGSYRRALMKSVSGIKIVSRPCPLFVPLVEEGWWDRPATRSVAEDYLSPFQKARIDVLILGCTHYPLLAPLLSRVVGRGVRLIDSGKETAREVREVLSSAGALRERGTGRNVFFATDGARRFQRLARRFLGRASAPVRLARLP